MGATDRRAQPSALACGRLPRLSVAPGDGVLQAARRAPRQWYVVLTDNAIRSVMKGPLCTNMSHALSDLANKRRHQDLPG